MKMPASFAEFSDALQKARIKDGSFCKNELTCIHYNGLTHAMIGWNADDEDGYGCDHGGWEFDLDRYSASLSAAMEITPDEKNPTASDSTMKSGYGVNQVVTARVNSSQRSATTALQNAVSYFPEFNYESFWRLLDRISISSSSSRLEFQKNEYSTYNRRTHFTPIWYPDGSYTVNTWVIDCWTPAGMLSVNLTDSLNIRGNLWDDWHIAPLDL